jgi:rSAM/selenodomain-associated transferase 1
VLFPRTRLLIFAKAPEPGTAKTRLIPRLGAAAAADLAQQLLVQTVQRHASPRCCPIQLWCAPHTHYPVFRRLAVECRLSLHAQGRGDLGARMFRAAAAALRSSEQVLLIGTDCPELGPAAVARAARWLRRGSAAVLGPAADGGYVLLGLRRADRRLFQGIAWGGPSVLRQTRARLRRLGWRWRELPVMRDLDRPEDLDSLAF